MTTDDLIWLIGRLVVEKEALLRTNEQLAARLAARLDELEHGTAVDVATAPVPGLDTAANV